MRGWLDKTQQIEAPGADSVEHAQGQLQILQIRSEWVDDVHGALRHDAEEVQLLVSTHAVTAKHFSAFSNSSQRAVTESTPC